MLKDLIQTILVQPGFSVSVSYVIFYSQHYILFFCNLHSCCQNMSLQYIDLDFLLKSVHKGIFLFFMNNKRVKSMAHSKIHCFFSNFNFFLVKIQNLARCPPKLVCS